MVAAVDLEVADKGRELAVRPPSPPPPPNSPPATPGQVHLQQSGHLLPIVIKILPQRGTYNRGPSLRRNQQKAYLSQSGPPIQIGTRAMINIKGLFSVWLS